MKTENLISKGKATILTDKKPFRSESLTSILKDCNQETDIWIGSDLSFRSDERF
jgi:hypothetical protein